VSTQALVAAFAGRTGIDMAKLDAAAAVVRPYLKQRQR
jgi:hypothetical protein